MTRPSDTAAGSGPEAPPPPPPPPPTSAAPPVRPAPHAAAMTPAHAPSVGLPLRFVVTGLLSLFVGVGWLLARPDLLATYHYNQDVIALTHLFTLGWLSSVIMGAMYQLVPVALETRLYSERLARWHFVFHVTGFLGMVWMFRVWHLPQVGYFGSIFAVGAGLFAWNMLQTLRRIPCWTVVAAGLATSFGWLLLTVLAGLFVASSKCWPRITPFDPIAQMHAHAHLGAVGFFMTTLVTVSYKLVPMFTLSEPQSRRRAAMSLALLNAGLLGLFPALLLNRPWKIACAGIIIAGFACYGLEMLAILRARKRLILDWGLRYFLTAIGLLAPLCALAIVLSWPSLPRTALTTQLETVYGFVALAGVLTFAILGMLYKIVPFLVWFAAYSPHIGRRKVPALAELYSPALQAVGYWLFLAGLAGASVAAALGHEPAAAWGCGLIAASLVTLGINMARILRHLVRPKAEPPPLKPAWQGTP